MVIDLNNTYRIMISMIFMMMMIMMVIMVNPQNGHKSANVEAITSKFCMVININDTYKLYFHAKS